MISRSVWLSLAALSALVAHAGPALGQPALSQAGPAQQALSADAARPPQPLGAERLDELLAPFAGAPQDVLGIVLDACRYPGELLEAAQWARQPEAARGPVKETWPPAVRVLAERAPRTLEYLTQDIATTATLGSAYQNQPNDVWMAYGRATALKTQEASAQQAKTAEQAPPREAARTAAPPERQAPPAPSRSTDTTTAQAPATAPATTAPASYGPAPVAAPQSPQVVTTAPPQDNSSSVAGAALVGGLVGLGAGLLIAELADNDDDYWGQGYGYRPPYAVPPPYAPYGGAYGGARYDASRALQEDRQAAGREMQANRQTYATGRREDWQASAAGQQQQRQAAADQRQVGRQQATQTNQAARQGATSERQGARRDDVAGGAAARQPPATRPPAGASTGPERRSAATAEQRPTQGPAAAQRRAAPQQVAAAAPQRAAAAQRAQPTARPPEWGPARGMSGGAEAARSRGAGAGTAAGGRAGGARAGGNRAGRN